MRAYSLPCEFPTFTIREQTYTSVFVNMCNKNRRFSPIFQLFERIPADTAEKNPSDRNEKRSGGFRLTELAAHSDL